MTTSRDIPVSVVIPAFNAQDQLARTFGSIERQRVRPQEIIVVDDGSSDGTAEAAAHFGARVYRSAANRGPAAARNTGVRIARYDWIAFLDADDAWHEEKLERQWAAINTWPAAGFCITDYDVINDNGSRTFSEGTNHPGYAQIPACERRDDAVLFSPQAIVDGLVRSMFVRQSSVVANRAHFLRSGGYDESLRLAEDYDLFLRMSATAPVISVERALVVYHRRAESLSADPVAEIRSIDALWSAMLERPDVYPSAMLERVRTERVPMLRRGLLRALRLGRFADAAGLAERAHTLEPSGEMARLAQLARWCDSPTGTNVHRAARALWRARHISSSPN